MLAIRRVFSESGMVADYKVRYMGGDFESLGRTLTENDISLLRGGIREFYDEWAKQKQKRTLKKAGIMTAVGLGVIALVTGLSVVLTRKGADMVHQAKKWEKLHPSRRTSTIPWTTIEKAGGKTIIFAGEYYLVISAGIYLLVRRRRS